MSRPDAAHALQKEEGGAQKAETENTLRRIKSRELRGGIMYYSCHCIKRNGLQHDCRRTGCGGEPACMALPDPLCAPSQLARARGLADPAPLARHHGGASEKEEGGAVRDGKRFIVCELKSLAAPTTDGGTGCECCCGPKAGKEAAGQAAADIKDPIAGLPIVVMKLC